MYIQILRGGIRLTIQQLLNGNVLYITVIVGLLFIITIAFLFFIKSRNRALELGVSKDDLKKVIKSSIIFSIVPSIAIVIALFSLASVLGIPWSWFRLSVVGSLAYELMAAEMSVTGAGYDSLSHFLSTGDILSVSTIMFVMSLSIIGGILFTTIFAKKLQTGMQNYQSKNAEWGTLAMSYFMLSIAIVFLPIQVSQGLVFLFTLLTSATIALLHIIIIKKWQVKWLNEFVLANSLILGMISSIFWDKLF